MDRLDVWLNAQRGWRRFALLMLQVGAPCVVISFGCFGLLNRLPAHGLPLAGIIALGVVAAGMTGLLDAWRARNGRSERAVRLSWRVMAYTPVIMSPFILILLTANASPEWDQQHHALKTIALFVLLPCVLIVTLERMRYERRVRETAELLHFVVALAHGR
jgi:hypothetical protein